MQIITAASRADALRLAEELYDRECDLLKCPTPKSERVTRMDDEPLQHKDTRAYAVRVSDRALAVVGLLADRPKLVATSDIKWKRESELKAEELAKLEGAL